MESTGGWGKDNDVVIDIFCHYAKSRGKFLSRFWTKANIAFAHRKELLYAVHEARDKIISGMEVPLFKLDFTEGLLASEVMHHP